MLEQWRSQTNLINVLFAAILFVSPWLLGFSYETAGLNAWASGLLLGLVSVVAILSYAEWEEWIDLAVGAWILGSPWVLGFPAESAATKVHVTIGLIVTVLAAAELWKEHSQPAQDIKLLR
jgi:hypothetical protein